MRRKALLLLALIIHGFLLLGQESPWMPVPDVTTGVSVEMPGLPQYEQKTIFLNGMYVVKEIFAYKEDRFTLVFESQRLPDNDKKTIARSTKLSIDHLALYEGGKPGKPKTFTRDGNQYQYVEYTFTTGKSIRSVLFVDKGKLFHIYVRGSQYNAFGIDANYYLASWKLADKIADVAASEETNSGEEISEPATAEDTWHPVNINNQISASFPGRPFKRTTFVEFGSKDILVTAYSKYWEPFNMNYVLTFRDYGNEEGQLSNDDLYTYIIDQISDSKKVKLIERCDVERNGIKTREYVLSKGIRFYRLQLFRMENSVYQVLIKGKRRTIDRPEANRFFNSIKSLD